MENICLPEGYLFIFLIYLLHYNLNESPFSGYDFNNGIDHHELLRSFKYSGFQATSLGNAIDEINNMVCVLDLQISVYTLKLHFRLLAEKKKCLQVLKTLKMMNL